MNHLTQPLSSVDFIIYSLEISKFCHIKKFGYRLHFDTPFLVLLTVYESLRIILINTVTILMMSAKMATLGFLRHQQNLLRDLNCIVDMVM